MKTYQFKSCVVEEYPDTGYIRTIFLDGTEVGASRDDTSENRCEASTQGYASVYDSLREHEIAHVFLMEWIGKPHSQVFWNLAHNDRRYNYWVLLWEESVAIAFQEWLNMGGDLENYPPLVHIHDIERCKEEFLRLMRPHLFEGAEKKELAAV